MSGLPDTEAGYRALLQGGIVVWPVEKAQFDLEMGDRPEGPLDEWTTELVVRAKADGLRAARFWFKAAHSLLTWPFVRLLRPDESRYPYPSADFWDDPASLPSQERAAALLRPLIEQDWGETLIRARERAGVQAGDTPEPEQR